MSVPAGKTPISFLQEICTKKGITPQYDLIANEGAVHEPTFVIRVSVGEVTATGKGKYLIFILQNDMACKYTVRSYISLF